MPILKLSPEMKGRIFLCFTFSDADIRKQGEMFLVNITSCRWNLFTARCRKMRLTYWCNDNDVWGTIFLAGRSKDEVEMSASASSSDLFSTWVRHQRLPPTGVRRRRSPVEEGFLGRRRRRLIRTFEGVLKKQRKRREHYKYYATIERRKAVLQKLLFPSLVGISKFSGLHL